MLNCYTLFLATMYINLIINIFDCVRTDWKHWLFSYMIGMSNSVIVLILIHHITQGVVKSIHMLSPFEFIPTPTCILIWNTKCHRFALFKLKSSGTSCLITTHPPPRLVFKVSVNLATLSISLTGDSKSRTCNAHKSKPSSLGSSSA